MLTETQYKVLIILFDDKGHAGWELADTLRMEESNLNPLLKKLEKKNFIFQGPPRKSNRPKRSSKIEKREGDYKEFPYYINNNLEVFGSVIKDMIVTNRSYDLGFPFRKIRGSNYWRSMKGMFKEDFDFYLSDLLRKMNISITRCCIIEEPLRLSLDDLSKLKLKELHFIEERPPIKERRVSEKLLDEIEIWWILYDIRRCCSQNPINIEEISEILENDLPDDYVLGEDVIEMIFEAVNKLPNHEELPFWIYINSLHDIRIESRNYSQSV